MLKLILNYDKKGERKKLYYYIKSINNSWNIISKFMKSLSRKAVANTMHHPLYVTEVIEMCEYRIRISFLEIIWEECFEKNNIIFEITQ